MERPFSMPWSHPARRGWPAGDGAGHLGHVVTHPVSGETEEDLDRAKTGAREQIAFYGSTPAYKKVLDLHGWGDLGTELNALSRGDDPDRWTTMGTLVDDEVLRAFAVTAEPEGIGPGLIERFGDVVDRMSFYAPYPHDESLWVSRRPLTCAPPRRPEVGSHEHGR